MSQFEIPGASDLPEQRLEEEQLPETHTHTHTWKLFLFFELLLGV